MLQLSPWICVREPDLGLVFVPYNFTSNQHLINLIEYHKVAELGGG